VRCGEGSKIANDLSDSKIFRRVDGGDAIAEKTLTI
jgi:hypothetical protein